MGVIIVSKREWARGLDSREDFLIFKAVWLPRYQLCIQNKGQDERRLEETGGADFVKV